MEWIARTMVENRPGTVIWAMGATQHARGTGVSRRFCHLQMVLGNMGKPGGGCDVFRGHDSIQGVTDIGGGPETLPGYYGVGEDALATFFKSVATVPYDWLVSRFQGQDHDGRPGFTVARWYEGVLMDPKDIGQDVNLKAVMFWGHSTNSISQMDRVKKALEKVELIVDIDPFVTNTAVLPDRKDGICPAGGDQLRAVELTH